MAALCTHAGKPKEGPFKPFRITGFEIAFLWNLTLGGAKMAGNGLHKLPFERLISADWSTHPGKRWACVAEHREDGWLVSAPTPVGEPTQFVDALFEDGGPILAGFDFPIGLPQAYGVKTGLPCFNEALDVFGSGDWSRFYDVSEVAGDISIHRPFYPQRPGGTKQLHLLNALNVQSLNELRRRCELPTSTRRAASPLFWTLGGNQVGKAAISGWQSVIQPARRRGAKLWPFDGSLAALVSTGAPVLAEIYPGEAYGHVGVSFRGGSKTHQQDRTSQANAITAWCARTGAVLTKDCAALVADGFGADAAGEDAFDALLGLLSMIDVVEGRRAASPQDTGTSKWEGWILGQAEQ